MLEDLIELRELMLEDLIKLGDLIELGELIELGKFIKLRNLMLED